MKKFLSLILIFCLILMMVACGAANQTEETSSNDGAKQTTMFEATILQVSGSYLLVQTDDPNMLRCSDQFELTLPEGVSGDGFVIGDVIEIEFHGSILEVYPARISNVISVRNISASKYPERVTFFARILSGGNRSLYVKGDAGHFGMYSGLAHLPKDISGEEYRKGDYVAITFPGYIMESYPPQINIISIRHLTEFEIAKFPEAEEKSIRLQYMGRDETRVIGICNDQAYAISPDEFENIPEMVFGDYFTVVYEELLLSMDPVQILFIKELYLSDENGNCIE